MIPCQLSFFGLGSYAGREELDFEHDLGTGGLFLIHGATGAGKTTILDAITDALYGRPSGENRTESTFRADLAPADKPSWAELVFAIGTNRYRIRRQLEFQKPGLKTLKPRRAELYAVAAEGEQLLASKVTDVNTRITEIIGLEHAQFCQVVLLPQGDFQKFLMADVSERSKILQKIFRTERYERLADRLAAKARKIETDRHELGKKDEARLEQIGAKSRAELSAAVKAETKNLAMLLKAERTAKAAAETAQREKQAADLLEKQFQEMSARERELAEIEAKKDRIEVWRQSLAHAEHAAPLMKDESRAKSLAKELENRKKTREQAEKEAARAAEDERRAAESLAEEEARGEEREQLQRERARLEGLSDAAALLAAAEKEYQAARCAAEAARKTATDAEKRHTALSEKAEQLTAEEKKLLQMQTAVSELTQKKNALEKNRDILHKGKECSCAVQKAAKKAEKAKKLAAKMRERAEAAAKYAAQQRELYRLSVAFTLADGLKDGMPCPVCGSTHHPQLAVRDDIVPTKEELEKAETIRDAAQRKASAASEAAVAAETKHQGEIKRLADAREKWEPDFKSDETLLAAELKKTTDALLAAQEASKQLPMVQEERKRNTAAKETAAAKEKRAKDELQAAAAAEGTARGQVTAVQKRLPEELRAPGALTAAMEKTSHALAAATRALDTTRQKLEIARTKRAAADAAKRSAEEEVVQASTAAAKGWEDFRTAVKKAGFTEEEYRDIVRNSQMMLAENRENVKKSIDAFDAALIDARAAFRAAKELVDKKIRPDTIALAKKERAATAAAHEVTKRAAAAAAALKQKKYVQQQLAKSDEAYEVLSEKYRIAGTLADVASGRMGGMNMPFSVYVQRSIFAEVMDAANRRLAIMSRDRYQLVFGDIGEGDRRKKAGLELSVLDSNSGKKRDVKSLSGGESFLASLSLALGLSDIVQEYAGGVRLDTMFIDEGFGALDQEKLDIALNVLTKLHTEGARLVGIISHVEGLEQRIPARLEVTRTASGSRAHFVFGTKEI